MHHVYTIGHSTQPIDAFTAQLKRHGIEVVADVRSNPYSGRFPHFSKDSLIKNLKDSRIGYVFLGRELGARRDEPECYVDGTAEYEKIALLPAFGEGIDRLLSGGQRYRIALMCAEHDPLTCHRTILVCRQLKKHGVLIKHIRRGGELEEHHCAEKRLITEELGSDEQSDMFAQCSNPRDRLESAYAKRADSIAYRKDERSDDHSHDRVHAEIR